MQELPTGTVTFLMTDVEGSTSLWESEAAAMPAAMERHDKIIEEAVGTRGGFVIKPRGEGDSRFAVFPKASDAVGASVAIQQGLAAEHWPTATPVRVRAALHTGFADLRLGDYYGSAVNRCARVRSLGHGGQTLMSMSTYEAIKDDPLPRIASLRDLGEHRLKDLTRPEQVFQIDLDELPNQFPPLSSIGATPNNLPEQLTEFVGRRQELAETKRLLGETRLLTILAPGGAGKTRLALQAAAEVIEQYPQGVFLIDLSPISSPADMVQTIAESIGVPLSSDEEPLEQLLRYLANKRQLLVMDNFDQLVQGAPLVTEILHAAPSATVVATSRARLNLSGETILALPGLDAEWDSPKDALQASGVQLFIGAAQRRDSAFTLSDGDLEPLRQILQIVNGMPLGILLAAAWVDILSIGEIAAEIDRSLDFLEAEMGDVSDRHRSIRAVFDYSWELLDDDEREMFSALSVFQGGFTRDAAEQVANASLRGLAKLVDKSFVTTDRESARFAIHELLRQYGAAELASEAGRLEAVTDGHASYYAGLIETVSDLIRESDQPRALELAEADIGNVRAAWYRCVTTADGAAARKFIEALWFLYEMRGWYPAALDLFSEAADVFCAQSDGPSAAAGALARSMQAWFAAVLSQPDLGAELAADAVAGLRSLSDPKGLVLALQSRCLSTMYAGDLRGFRAASDEAATLAPRAGHPWEVAIMRDWEAHVDLAEQKPDHAAEVARQALDYFERTDEHFGRTYALNALAGAAVAKDRPVDALAYYRQSAEKCREIGYRRGLQFALTGLGDASAASGDPEGAEGYYVECLELSYDLGQTRETLAMMLSIAKVRAAMGHAEQAIELVSAILADPAGSQQMWAQPTAIHELAEETRAELEHQLDPDAYAASWTRGRSRSTDVAAEALLAVRRR